jgi:ubiquinone/menaquinone biosynthesis C-methylase UbiE
MTAGQRLVRLVTDVVVRVPFAWRLFRGSMARSFDKLAPTWEGRISDERLAPMKVALGGLAEPPATVLDLGTGTGRVARLVAEVWPQAKVVGADLSPGMIDEARRLGGDVHYDVADAAGLPYDDGAFELVTLSNMIPFFDELARVTAPGGSVIVAFTMGDRTPIYVPFARVRSELEQRGFSHVADFDAGSGTALLAKKADRA